MDRVSPWCEEGGNLKEFLDKGESKDEKDE